MKSFLLFVIFSFISCSFGMIPDGDYKIEKIQCKSGKTLKLGGKFLIYDIFLNINSNEMTMTAKAHAGDWAPFKLECTQVNKGNFTYISSDQYEGSLPNISVQCNNDMWTNILKKKLFGVENFGKFSFTTEANQLVIYNKDTVTKYSCDQANDYPIYYYNKI